MRKTLLLLVPVLALGACSWGINLNDAGKQIRTAWNGDVSSACTDLGKVTVSVMDHVGPVDRNDIKVRDELEVMARNEAASMQADTIKPLGEPVDGAQSWAAYRCGKTVASPAGTTAVGQPPLPGTDADKAQTYPIKGG